MSPMRRQESFYYMGTQVTICYFLIRKNPGDAAWIFTPQDIREALAVHRR